MRGFTEQFLLANQNRGHSRVMLEYVSDSFLSDVIGCHKLSNWYMKSCRCFPHPSGSQKHQPPDWPPESTMT